MQLPAAFIERSFSLGIQGGALARLRRRLSCNTTSPAVNIAVAGGSVTAGPGGRSWANYMMEALKNEVQSRHEFTWKKLASNGVGPAYLSGCWDHHFDNVPDIVFLEYSVNDFGPSNLDMEVLVRKQIERGTLVVLLHHFTPNFIVGGEGYKSLHNVTAEAKHSRLVQHYGLSSVSVGEAVGLSHLSTAWKRAATAQTVGQHAFHRTQGRTSKTGGDGAAMLHPCAFLCSIFTTKDGIHPSPCGQHMMGQLATYAVRRLLRLDEKTPVHRSQHFHRCLPEKRQAAARECVPLPAPESWRQPVSKGKQQSLTSRPSSAVRNCYSTTACWSNVGAPETWNLKPTRNRGFTQIDLKASSRKNHEVPGGSRIFKMLWEGRKPGSFVEFSVQCSSLEYQAVRLTYLTGHALHYGHAKITIDGATVGIGDAFRPKQGNLFKAADYTLPTKCGGKRPTSCPVESHVVRVTVLNATSDPGTSRKRGFGLNSIMCIHQPWSQSTGT